MALDKSITPRRPVRPAGLTAWDPELACPGYTLYCHIRGDPVAYLLDMRGEPVKTWDGGGNHFVNFINAVRSQNYEDLNADVLEGHRRCLPLIVCAHC